MLWPIAHSAAELLSSKKYARVNQCAAKGCYRLFVGNKRRKWCDANTCGSRLKGRRSYRLHHRTGQQIDEALRRKAALRKEQWFREKRLEAKKRKAMERKAAKAAAESKDAEEPDPEGSEQP